MNGKKRKRLWKEHQRMMYEACIAVVSSDITMEQKQEAVAAIIEVSGKSFRQLKRGHVRPTNRP